MGYCDDFYVKANIIGYTGDLKDSSKVTVYFRNGNKFGRITQDHPHQDNIGRNQVRDCGDYRIGNNANNKCEEFYNGAVKHTSRNAFVAVPQTSVDTIDVLAKAITAFPNAKSKY